MGVHDFYVTSSPYQQGVGNRINLKMDYGLESIFLLGTDNTLLAKISTHLTN